MSQTEARRLIETHFSDSWAAGPFAATPVAWPNVPFVPPAGGEWLRLTVRNATTNFPETSVRVTRTEGAVFVQCFTPQGTGAKRALLLAGVVDDIFRGRNIGGVTFHACNVVDVGDSVEGAYWQINVDAPFVFDFVR